MSSTFLRAWHTARGAQHPRCCCISPACVCAGLNVRPEPERPPARRHGACTAPWCDPGASKRRAGAPRVLTCPPCSSVLKSAPRVRPLPPTAPPHRPPRVRVGRRYADGSHLRSDPSVTRLAKAAVIWRWARQAARHSGKPPDALHKRSLCKLAADSAGALPSDLAMRHGACSARTGHVAASAAPHPCSSGLTCALPSVSASRSSHRAEASLPRSVVVPGPSPLAPSLLAPSSLTRCHAVCSSPLRGGSRRASAPPWRPGGGG